MSEASDGVIQHLVETIDDNPDRLHVDVTPSVRELSALRLPAAKAVLPLMDHTSKVTRMRAFRVLGNVVMRHHGWESGRGYADPGRDEEVQSLMLANGDYDIDAEPEARRESIARWRNWLDKEMANG